MRVAAKLGDEVIIHFLDHVEDDERPLPCVVRGRVIGRGRGFVTIEGWTPVGDPPHDTHNRKRWSIVTSTVLGYAIARPKWTGERPRL